MPTQEPRLTAAAPRDDVVLILSGDAIVAALLAALVETLGFNVRFVRAPSNADDAMRRHKPRICLVNCDDRAMCSDEIIGRALMRRAAVVVFGTAAVMNQLRDFASRHELQSLLMPATIAEVEAVFERALAS